MRENKFRGISKIINRMVYGQYIKAVGDVHIISSSDDVVPYGCEYWYGIEDGYEVDSKTVGQCTGSNDINDNEIYEGDIVIYKNNKFQIKYEMGSFMLVRISQETDMYSLFKDC